MPLPLARLKARIAKTLCGQKTRPVRQAENPKEQRRRAKVERQQTFTDREEEYERNRAAATTDAERQKVKDDFTAYRRKHREEDVASGTRPAGVGVILQQNMWWAWIDIAVRHELEARDHIGTSTDPSNALGKEFAASLVAVTASAIAVEALYGELKYLVPPQNLDKRERPNEQYKTVRNTLALAFGLDEPDKQRLGAKLKDLFERRNDAVHPYSEALPPAPHPSGVYTTVELARLFNADTSRKAVDCALYVLAIAAAPPQPTRWVQRWVHQNASAHTERVDPLRLLRNPQ
jgi:hypothetical protein